MQGRISAPRHRTGEVCGLRPLVSLVQRGNKQGLNLRAYGLTGQFTQHSLKSPAMVSLAMGVPDAVVGIFM